MKKVNIMILLLVFSSCITSIVLGFMFIDLSRKYEFSLIANSSYAISNGKNVGRIRLEKNPQLYEYLKTDYFIDPTAAQITGIQENIGDVFSHGVKKIPLNVMLKTHPEEWQARGFAKIYIEEMEDFIFEQREDESEIDRLTRVKHYWNYLGKRYCGWNTSYGDSMFILWCKAKNLNHRQVKLSSNRQMEHNGRMNPPK